MQRRFLCKKHHLGIPNPGFVKNYNNISRSLFWRYVDEMKKNRYKDMFKYMGLSLPIVFVLVFFGYFRLNYDIVIHTDNIKGEGICHTYVCSKTGPAAFYKVEFYFGSELKEATIKGFHYDVDHINLVTSDVTEFDIIEVDSYVHGIHLGHFNSTDILPDGQSIEGEKGTISSRDGVLHVDVKDPNVGATVVIGQAFIPAWFWVIYIMGIIMASVLFAALLAYILERIPSLELPLLSATCIVVTLLAGCFFCGSLPYVTYVNFILNWLFLMAIAIIINALTLPWIGTVLMMIFTTTWYIANYFVITLRGKPIMPADLNAIGTAEEVMGGYSFIPSWQMILGVAIVVLYAVMLIKTWKRTRQKVEQSLRKQILIRGVSVIIAIFLIVIGVNTRTFKNLDSFAWDGVLIKSFHEEGMVLTYLKSVFNSRVKMPEGYSREVVDEYLKEYDTSAAMTGNEVQPTNIIMVMDEAFSDLRVVGLNEKIDVMPFIDSLDTNTIEGNLNVSVYGGGTCNTEFEALTGNTMAFLGTGAYPYTESVTNPMFSLASYFKNYKYATEAFHANDPDNWNRSMVYPNFGFERFNSIADFEEFGDMIYLHQQPADATDFKFMESVDAKYKGEKRFLFDVTMQNHSPYDRWLDVEKAETVKNNGADLYFDTQVYLSMIKVSDDEVKQLVETYQDSDEPTMIIYFGDHQPGLPSTAINEIYTEVESNLDIYKTRFFIWTNYDSESEHNMQISANYLPMLILKHGNFPLPPYIRMLEEVHEKYPVISSQGVMDSKGNVYAGVADVMDDPLIRKYQYIQYANMFDEIDQGWFETE